MQKTSHRICKLNMQNLKCKKLDRHVEVCRNVKHKCVGKYTMQHEKDQKMYDYHLYLKFDWA